MPPPTKTRDDVQDEQIARLKRELNDQERRLREQQKALQAQKKKKGQALATFNFMFIDVTRKAQDLRAAAVRIGKAYSTAAGRHRDAVSKQNQMKALETQLMFSVLTILSSGALTWVTEAIKAAGAAKAAAKMSEYERVLDLVKSQGRYGRDLAAVATRLKDELTRRVSARDLFTSITKDTLAAGLGEVFSALGPMYAPPVASDPASQEPLEFQDDLTTQIDTIQAPVLQSLGKMAEKIKNLPDEAWDKYDDKEFQKAYQKWQTEAGQLAGVNDLPGEKDMANELERFIWAVWMPGLKTTQTQPGGCTYAGGPDAVCWDPEEVEVFERVRQPVNDRFVALGIETEEQTDWKRDKEDPMLIAWAEKYLQTVKPWVSGKAKPPAVK